MQQPLIPLKNGHESMIVRIAINHQILFIFLALSEFSNMIEEIIFSSFFAIRDWILIVP
ncbi:MAG: hypothetical protein E7C14_14955 [Enterobacter sp.]|uniref:hypothetical protein n=1 Tax=Enterobacteriaceae TaxID=543 RepID=UPI0014853E4E|nr:MULTISPECIES: hypothetical protein [Enterobacteriaceae]MDU2769064.1 hypothetical protein [Enterobacter sp.]HBE7202388.1 hypothetical protein [Escherichia coli]HBH8385205.1 hypothetical protein [Escherichia coli]HCD8413603.1 hypothetical protein [Escherichia coli]HCX5877255.1 hypothetical protein [Escherichia coli]